MRLSLDKVHESIYHYRNAKEKIDSIESVTEMQKLVHIVNEFRFEISALSSSVVSIKYALLKEANIIGSESLNQWIKKHIEEEVFKDKNFQLIYKLRNVNIHKGNIFLTFKFSTKVSLGILKFEVDLSKEAHDAVLGSEFLPPGYTGNPSAILSNSESQGVKDSLTPEDELTIWKSIIGFYNKASEEAVEKNNFYLEVIKLPQLKLEYPPAEFLEICKEAGELLQNKILDVRKTFDFEKFK